MGDTSKIEWTDATWNPVTGCTKVSPGCDHCYAEGIANRFRGPAFPNGFEVTLRKNRLEEPLKWRGRRVFVNSMSDLFHDDIPDDYIAQVFAVMARSYDNTFQVLTKRHGRMRSLLNSEDFEDLVADYLLDRGETELLWPLPNVWLGVSVENQQWANIRIPALLGTPAAVRFLSIEPLLGPIDLTDAFTVPVYNGSELVRRASRYSLAKPYIAWVIVGGESGAGARPMNPEWVRAIRDQCETEPVAGAFFFKQWGGHDEHGQRMGKRAAGRLLDGRTWDEYPASPGPDGEGE